MQSYWCLKKVIRWYHPLSTCALSFTQHALVPLPPPIYCAELMIMITNYQVISSTQQLWPLPPPPLLCKVTEWIMQIESHQVMSSTRRFRSPTLPPILCRVTDADWNSSGDVIHSTLLIPHPPPPCCAELLMLIESHQVMSSTRRFWSPTLAPYCAQLLMLIESHQVMSSIRRFWSTALPPPPPHPILCGVTDADWKSSGDVIHSTLVTPFPHTVQSYWC